MDNEALKASLEGLLGGILSGQKKLVIETEPKEIYPFQSSNRALLGYIHTVKVVDV